MLVYNKHCLFFTGLNYNVFSSLVVPSSVLMLTIHNMTVFLYLSPGSCFTFALSSKMKCCEIHTASGNCFGKHKQCLINRLPLTLLSETVITLAHESIFIYPADHTSRERRMLILTESRGQFPAVCLTLTLT